MYSVVTLASKQRRMKDFYNLSGSKYVLIGRSTPWQNENIPPVPSETQTTIEELIGCKLMKAQYYTKLLEDPTPAQQEDAIYYKGLYYYKTQSLSDAIANGCDSIIITAELDRGELPLTTYRQVGLQVEVQYSAPTMTAAQFNNLSPTNKGTLEVIENRKPQTRSDDQMEEISILITF